MRRVVGLAATIMAVTFFSAQSAAPPPTIREFDVPTLQALGQQIYYQDSEAARATDLLFARKGQSALSSEGVRGWIVDPAPAQDVVRFIRQGDSGLEAAYDIVFVPGLSPRLELPETRALTDEEKSQFAARLLALKNIERPCSDRYNTVALKDPEQDGWLVWALATTTDPQKLFIGGHYRFMISKDGQEIIRRDALSRACLTSTRSQDTKDKKTVMDASIQLVSNIPVETDVWLSLQSKIPMLVITPDRTEWGVADGKIWKVGVLQPKPSTPPDGK